MIKRSTIIGGALLLAAIIAITGCPSPAGPVAPADFYKGKSIELVSMASPGTLNDLILRIMASYISEDTGASVSVTARKGAGGIEGANYIYKAKPDGLTLGMTSMVKFVGNKVLDEPAAEYELEEMSYIMSIAPRQTYFYVSPEGPYQTVAELQAAADLKLGATSASGYYSLAGLTVIKLLGLDAQVITGFQKSSDIKLALQRGEITGYAVSTNQADIDSGIIRPVFVIATERDPLKPNVPTITELVDLSGEDLELVKLWETGLINSGLFFTSPGLPEDKLAYLRDLANKWSQDEGFRKQIDAVTGEEVTVYFTGEEVTSIMLDTSSVISQFQAIFAELAAKYRA
jgi:tripartite-type tricarboxylate transporter receptor subunit TctC